jgi:hypothetical protein
MSGRYGAVKVLVIVVAVALLAPAAARADGDPASDVLLTQDVFLTYSVGVPQQQARELRAVVAAARKAGVRVRVALIATPADLGAVPVLFGQPKRYAQFLGSEIRFVYPGRLLVVMPAGYGVSRAGSLIPREQGALDKLSKPAAGGAGLAEAADTAIRRLAALHGKPLHAFVQPAANGGGTTTRDRLEIVAIALCALAIFAIFAVPRRRRRRSSAT